MADSAASRIERIRSTIDQYQGRLIAFAARITGDLDSGRDVVQDTFLRLCVQDLDAIADHLPAWLFSVCRNRALDVRKKEGPLQPLDDTYDRLADRGADPLSALEHSDTIRRVLQAFATLPEAQKEVLRLRFQEELSYREISQITHHSVSNVGFLIHTGIRKVRERLRAGDEATRPRSKGGQADA